MTPSKTASVHRVYFAEILRALAIFAVIILHNSADYGEQYGTIPMSHWWAGTIWDGLVRFCVPMFIMLSGAFLLKKGKDVSVKEVFTKRLPKIVIPLIFWSIIYVLFNAYHSEEGIRGMDVKEQFKVFIEGPVPGAYHFWFLYMLVGIYLLYPIINLFITAAKEEHIRYFLIVWFVVNCLFSIIEILFDWTIGIDQSFFTGYVGYFVLGYYLFNHVFTAKQLKTAYLLGIGGFILSVSFPYLCRQLHFENTSSLIESDFTPDILLSEIGLFLWFKNRTYSDENTFSKRFITEINNESFGIYLVHVLLMDIIFSEERSYFDIISGWHPGWFIPIKAIIVLLLSYGVIKLIRLVPYLRKVAG
jgi:surface polysaccharide O-acyltransferase-like enzyme